MIFFRFGYGALGYGAHTMEFNMYLLQTENRLKIQLAEQSKWHASASAAAGDHFAALVEAEALPADPSKTQLAAVGQLD